jgi:hypothetical protein
MCQRIREQLADRHRLRAQGQDEPLRWKKACLTPHDLDLWLYHDADRSSQQRSSFISPGLHSNLLTAKLILTATPTFDFYQLDEKEIGYEFGRTC